MTDNEIEKEVNYLFGNLKESLFVLDEIDFQNRIIKYTLFQLGWSSSFCFESYNFIDEVIAELIDDMWDNIVILRSIVDEYRSTLIKQISEGENL